MPAAGWYGSFDTAEGTRKPRRFGTVASGSAALAVIVLGSAAVLLASRSAVPIEREQPVFWEEQQDAPSAAQSMLQTMGPRQQARKSRRTLALEVYLNKAMIGVQSLDEVDHKALASGLRAHLSALDESNRAANDATEDAFPSASEAFSPEHQEELEAEVERLRSENAALKVATKGANTQIKSPLWPYQDYHFGYPWGYDKNNGWHQEIEDYSPSKDGCSCSVNNYHRYLTCNCGSAWGALTLQDDHCYGCCTHGCCNRCTCSSSSAGDSMGPTTCTCPLARNWARSNSKGCPGWWSDNAGPLDPGGTGGIPDIEDGPGTLMV